MRNRFNFFVQQFRKNLELPDILFMDREDFQVILNKYLQGKATPEEKRLVDAWYYKMGEEERSSFDNTDEARLMDRYWAYINSHINIKKKEVPDWKVLSMCGAGVAAGLIIIAIAYLNTDYGSLPIDSHSAAERKKIVYELVENKGSKAEVIVLPDGSRVTLEPRSKIKFASAFSGEVRKIYLDGKAFFEVVQESDRPFKVYTRKVITRVLGTSFIVSDFRFEKDVTVEVKTGKVSVITKHDAEKAKVDEVILTPNQQFIYHKEQQTISKSIVKEPQVVLPAEEFRRMRFEETSPAIVFEAIERAYGVDIVFDEKMFSSCRITTNISDGKIFNRLLIICEVINATYRVAEDKIIIEGQGC